MVLALGAFVKILFEILYCTGFIALVAFIPQTIRGFLFGFCGCLDAMP